MSSKRALVKLLALFPWLPKSANADSSLPTIPPARAFKWDISRKNSLIKQDFVVTRFDAYSFEIGFGGPDATDEDGSVRRKSDQSWRNLLGTMPNGPFDGPLSKFIGDGSYAYYAKDGSDPNPIVAKTAEERAKRDELLRRGEYVTKLGNPGVIVPVRIIVERIDSEGRASVITDQTIDTGGFRSGGYLLTRGIISGIRMKQGTYRVTAITLKDSPLPSGIGTYLLIPIEAKRNPPKDGD